MKSTMILVGLALSCVGGAALAAPPRVIAAAGRWAALRGPAQCDAASLAVLPLIVAAIATWRAPSQPTMEDRTRRERLMLACAVAALGVIVLALRIAASA